MKKLFLVLALSFSGFAFADSIVFPQIYNWGSSAQVQVHNTTALGVTCSGHVDLHTSSGTTDSFFYHEWVYPGAYAFRHFYPHRIGDRVRYVTHSIFCY